MLYNLWELVGGWIIIIIISIFKRDIFYQKMSQQRATNDTKTLLVISPWGLALNEKSERAGGTSLPVQAPFQRQKEIFSSLEPFQ